VAIGTTEGDLHDIGKNLVAMMLEGSGYEIVDLGVDVRPPSSSRPSATAPTCGDVGATHYHDDQHAVHDRGHRGGRPA